MHSVAGQMRDIQARTLTTHQVHQVFLEWIGEIMWRTIGRGKRHYVAWTDIYCRIADFCTTVSRQNDQEFLVPLMAVIDKALFGGWHSRNVKRQAFQTECRSKTLQVDIGSRVERMLYVRLGHRLQLGFGQMALRPCIEVIGHGRSFGCAPSP